MGAVQPAPEDSHYPWTSFRGSRHAFYDHAGFSRIVGPNFRHTVNAVPLYFEAIVSLRDPIGDNQIYETTYRMDLSHLMPYTMPDDDMLTNP